jgi:hypothetical protein
VKRLKRVLELEVRHPDMGEQLFYPVVTEALKEFAEYQHANNGMEANGVLTCDNGATVVWHHRSEWVDR